MNKTTLAKSGAAHYRLSTAEYAHQNLVEEQSVRKRYAKTGSYHGVRPLRLPNRRLLWPDNSIDSLVNQQIHQAQSIGAFAMTTAEEREASRKEVA
jgi:hypothetical protein